MTDTPRTDNAALSGDGTTVPADFAADLERELNEAKAEVERLREALTTMLSVYDRDDNFMEQFALKQARAAVKETK
jgi:hypothetical protein